MLTLTHGIDPDGLMFAVDDGTRLLQLCFFAGAESPRLSYGGRSHPEDFAPSAWTARGNQSADVRGRLLRISDTSTTDGRVYFVEDAAPPGSEARVLDALSDYIFETRLAVISHEADAEGFVGAFAQAFDGTRAVGIRLLEVAGDCYVAFHSDGADLDISARFSFNWGDGAAHTYRVRKSTAGNLVTLFGDGVLLGSYPYTEFVAPPADVVGILSFGSSTLVSDEARSVVDDEARSVVDWSYCNAWRVETTPHRYMGVWKGTDGDSLIGYQLPLKIAGGATVVGNVLRDPSADFDSAGVSIGDPIIVDEGLNKGVYLVESITGTELTIPVSWPVQPTVVAYRIPRETDWSAMHTYRLARDATGTVTVTIDSADTPAIQFDYGSTMVPSSGSGVLRVLSGGIPAVAFGSFSAEHLEQSQWDFVRYAMTRSATDLDLVPPHQVLNQWNVMESPERLSGVAPVALTSFKSSSTGSTPQNAPDFLVDPDMPSHTRLNQGTPLVPWTQTFERRGPFSEQVDESEEADGGYIVNDGEIRFRFVVPEDVLYASLQLVEDRSGEADLIAPFGDLSGPSYDGVQYQDEVCLAYSAEADALPEDSAAPTPWVLVSDSPGQVVAAVSSGVLAYGTGSGSTRTAYLNNSPLSDAPSLQTTATFRLRLVEDASLGLGDSEVRFGLSAPGMSVGIGFVTHPTGERFVEVFDLRSGNVMGRATVDYLDGEFHEYQILRDPSSDAVEVYIDRFSR
jgi:hypothetical protein